MAERLQERAEQVEENMSLLTEAMEPFYFYTKTRVDDGYGGYKNAYVKSESTFDAAITFDTSIEARRADKEGVKSLYTITTKKNVVLEYHDVIERARDKKVFRVTSDGDDKFTPNSATLDMRQVTAEEWELPNE